MSFKELMGEITQKELANGLGITQQSISRWVSGKGCPKTTDLPKIAKVLNVPVEQVLACFTEDDGEHKGEAV